MLSTLLLSAIGCSPVASLDDPTDATDTTEVEQTTSDTTDVETGPAPESVAPLPPRPPGLSLWAPPAWDPIATGSLDISVDVNMDSDFSLTLYGPDDEAVWTQDGFLLAGVSADLSWSDDEITSGAYQLEVTATDDRTGLETSARHTIDVVRCAASGAWLEDDGGETGLRIPLYWHISRTLQDLSYPVAALASLEDADGAALDLPAVSESLDVHTGAGMVEPSAWRWDSRPILTLELGGETVLGDTNLDGSDVALSVEGWTVLEVNELVDGGFVTLQRDEPLADFIGVVEEELTLRFTAADPYGGEDWTVATQALPLRMYAMYDAPTFDAPGELYSPWVAAIDAALRAVDGTAPDQAAVLDALVEWVFNDLGLTYDTRSGASAYTTYRGGWDSGHFYMTDFLERRFGEVVNCSDCASILTAYANMLGARLSYLIILQNFSLNEILAVGQDDYTSCPFGPSSCGFSYHAVTTVDGGERIWDATLALDGDDDPGASPYELLPVQGIAGEEYLDRLVRSGNAYYDYETIGSLQ